MPNYLNCHIFKNVSLNKINVASRCLGITHHCSPVKDDKLVVPNNLLCDLKCLTYTFICTVYYKKVGINKEYKFACSVVPIYRWI